MKAMHIVCSSDENMAMPAAAMLKSLFVNAPSNREIKVYFLDGGISDASKERLLRSLEPHDESVHFVKVDPVSLADMKLTGHVTLASYYRFLMPSLLPAGVQKAIYLDVDMIVDRDISELWDIDMKGRHLLAVPEQGKHCMYVSSPQGLSNYEMLGLEAKQKCFNSGVLVADLEKWRSDHITSKLIGYIKQNKEHVRWHDQDALNAILAHQWGELDYRWNVLAHLFNGFPWDAGPVKDRAVYRRLMRRPFIVHFNTSSKPWHAACNHPKTHLFFHYLDMTEWSGWRPEHFYAHKLSNFFKNVIKNVKRISWVRTMREFLKNNLTATYGRVGQGQLKMTTKPAIKSGCYSFKLPLDLEAGEKWKPYPIFSGATATLNDLSCHVSILGHGFSPHPPHSHDEEEVLIVLRGEIDIILKGSHPQEQPCRERLQKNQFVYYPAHFAHTLETTSEEPANYLMLKWLRAPSSEKNLIHFGCFNALPLQGTGKGQQGFSPQVVFEGATRYLKKLQCHTTALDPGASYPPHADSYDVAMFILDGEVRTLGQHIKAPGVIFYKAGTPHGIYNPAECTAKYLVFEFRT